MQWHCLGKVGCCPLLCQGIRIFHIPIEWSLWPCHLAKVQLIPVLRIASWRHIESVRLDKVSAVVCWQCVRIVSRLSWCSLALTNAPVVFVVPVQCDPDVSCFCPIAGEFELFLERVFEMLDVFLANVFHPKVVHDQCELYWPCVMLPKTGYQFTLSVAVFV